MSDNSLRDLANQVAFPAPGQADAGGILGPFAFGGLPYVMDSQGRIWCLTAPRGDILPTDVGLLEWNFDPATAAQSAALNTAQAVNVMRIQVRAPMVITNILWHVAVVGTVTFVAGQSAVGLYNSAGVLLSGSGDIASLLTTAAGPVSQALTTPQPVGIGFYWVAILNATTSGTQAKFAVAPNTPANANMGLPAAQSRFGVAATAQTALPASFTPSAISNTNAQCYWVGVS